MTEVKPGDKIPSVELRELRPGEEKPTSVNIADLSADKKVAILGFPGAFTPTCSTSHLPSFIDAQNELKQKGVEMIIAVATNDAYVMEVSRINKKHYMRTLPSYEINRWIFILFSFQLIAIFLPSS